AKRRSAQPTSLPRNEDGQSTWIKMIKRAFQSIRCPKLDAPAVPQIGRRLYCTEIPRVVIPCDLDRVFRALKDFQIIVCFVVAMAKNKIVTGFSHQDLPETKRNSFDDLLDGMFHRLGATTGAPC